VPPSLPCTSRAASSADSWAPPWLGAVVGVLVEDDEVADGEEEEDVDDVVEVVDVGSVNEVTDAAPGVGPSFADSANAVPAVTASAPAAMAPTSSFLVMSVPSHTGFSGTDHDAERGPMAALPEG
jgi:hypothetical protein